MPYKECNLLVMLKCIGTLILYGSCLSACNDVNGDSSSSTRTGPEFAREVVELAVPVNVKPNDINDYREFVLPPYSNTRIRLVNYTQNADQAVGYALVQLHAFEYNVTLSYNSTPVDGGYLSGQNVGLLMYGDGDLYALNLNPLQPVWVSLVLMLYNTSAPIPGGCNLEFPVEISPVLNLTLTPQIIIVDTPAASVARPFQTSPDACGKAHLQYESYYYTMPMHDFSRKSYFSAIRQLISYANAKVSGAQNTLHAPLKLNEHTYDRINGQGMVFVTAVIDPVHRGYALYVPTHTYSCKPFSNLSGCYGLTIPLRMLAVLVTFLAALEVVVGWLTMKVKTTLMTGGLFMFLTVGSAANVVDEPVSEEWTVTLLLVSGLAGLFFGWMISIADLCYAYMLCSLLTGNLMWLTLYGTATGNFYTTQNASWYIMLGGLLMGFILNIPSLSVQIVRSVAFSAIAIFYAVNIVFDARLDYPLRHLVRGLYVKSYERVYSDPALHANDFAALATFGFVLVVALVLRFRYRSTEVQDDETPVLLPCQGSRAIDDDENGIERSTVIAADDTAAYQRFFNEQPER